MNIPFQGNVNGRLVEKKFEGQVFYYVYDQQQDRGYEVGYGFLMLPYGIDQPMIKPFIKNKLAGYACGCSWGDIFTTMTEAKKHKASLENLYTEGFSSRPYIKLDMLKNIRNQLLEIESILKVIFSDDEDFSHISFSDVSANGIQVYVVGKERSYNYGFRATLNYDLSNKVSVIEMFLKRNKQQ